MKVERDKSESEHKSDTTSDIRTRHNNTSDLSECSERSKKINTSANETIELETSTAVAAWWEIFRKYRICSIQQATTTTTHTHQAAQVQPIFIKQVDSEAIGDMFQPAEDGIFRIYYQNLNGVSARKGTSKWNEINDIIAKYKIAIFGLTETNIEWNKHRTKAIMKATLRKHFKYAIMTTSTTTMKFKDDYKPGGTCTIISNNWTGRSLENINDTTGLGQ